MNHHGNRGRAVVAACAIAVGLGVGTAACGSGDRTEREGEGALSGVNDTAIREGAPVTLTGCLQRRDGTLTNGFILTGANGPGIDTPVSATGDTRAPVAGERLQAALHAYRLEGDDDKLEPHVGKQVLITGHVEETSDLRADRGERPSVGTGGAREIDPDDLTEVEVQTVQVVAEVCGAR